MTRPNVLLLSGALGYPTAEAFIHAADTTPMPVPDRDMRGREAHEVLEDVMRQRSMTVASLARLGVPADTTAALLAGGTAPKAIVRKLLRVLKEPVAAEWADALIAADDAARPIDAAIAVVAAASADDLASLEAAIKARRHALKAAGASRHSA